MPAKIALSALEEDLAAPLRAILRRQGHQVAPIPSAEIIFLGGDDPRYRQMLSALAEHRPGIPVVLVTRCPDTRRWLDALELGAADYCGAPFEPIQIEWLLNAVIRQAKAA